MQPYALKDLMEPFREVTLNVALYLPRTSDLRQLSDYADPGMKVKIVHYCMEGASKVSSSHRSDSCYKY